MITNSVENNASDHMTSERWMVCIICKQQKDKEQFVVVSHNKKKPLKKYSKICNQCRSKIKKMSLLEHFKPVEDDDDDSGSRGKGFRNTIDCYARMFMFRAQKIQQAIIQAIRASDRAKMG
jgi:hypothetical protein